ncbi:hypothetical protein GCM10010272_59120 [Streptomyces lateritius]|nr:hypothetical protein GCM10010272_59120 [Streptomyces lateritius]
MALVVALVMIVWTLVSARYGSEPTSRTVIGWLLIAAGCGALCFRRRLPVTVAVVTLPACVVYYPLSAQDGPLMIAFALALYTTAAETEDPLGAVREGLAATGKVITAAAAIMIVVFAASCSAPTGCCGSSASASRWRSCWTPWSSAV